MARNEQDTDIAVGQLLPDIVFPVGVCLDVPVGPHLGITVPGHRPQKRLDVGAPLNFPVTRLFGFVAAAVADKDDRPSRRASHGSCSDNLSESLPAQKTKSKCCKMERGSARIGGGPAAQRTARKLAEPARS